MFLRRSLPEGIKKGICWKLLSFRILHYNESHLQVWRTPWPVFQDGWFNDFANRRQQYAIENRRFAHTTRGTSRIHPCIHRWLLMRFHVMCTRLWLSIMCAKPIVHRKAYAQALLVELERIDGRRTSHVQSSPSIQSHLIINLYGFRLFSPSY